MLHVNLFDNSFASTFDSLGYVTSTMDYKPKNIVWLDKLMKYDGITVFTDWYIDSDIFDKVESRLKIFWLFEPRALAESGGIYKNTYKKILEIEDKFDYILTYDEELLKRSPKYLKYIVGQSRIPDEVAKIYPKTKGVSMIASWKRDTEGHKLRHQIIKELQPKYNFDVWGSGYRPFEDKLEPLKDYKYSICVMNSSADNFFTEVLLDCFRVGTIPIFWGCPNINEYFSSNGMIHFETIKELDNILSKVKIMKERYLHYDLDDVDYFLQKNFDLVKKYTHTDDYIATILENL